ncbi:LLM class flavin-dependent oxidoreductase [Polymorphobacter sp.]|uniref:LLM class flavin-dependent oxidoreductase n=1 Tax=Polymorphobacter sp. TaxID=1909290 RepID=UPI003F71495A
MKFGVFLPNGSNGYIPSAGSPQYMPSYAHNKAVTLEAEQQGLDFVLSMMKFKGFGGDTGYWNGCMESFTLMAALAADTSRIGLFPSVTLLSTHPAIAARMIATIDDISQGRCGLNIVTGWNKPEYTQMGLWRGDEYFDRRYDFADEYLGIVKALWKDGETTWNGEFFQLNKCTVLPRPAHDIPIVCAGQSPKGIEFTARMGDHNFVIAHADALKPIVQNVRAESAKNNRRVGTYGLFHMITARTDAEARALAEDIVAKADKGAITNILASAAMDTNTGGTADRMKSGLSLTLEQGNVAFMGIPLIHGSPETVATKIDEIAAETGVEGLLFSWPDFVEGIRDFGEKVMPRLKCMS